MELFVIEECKQRLGDMWKMICNECGREVERTVQLGDEPDYESSTAWICEECLRKALSLIEQSRE